MWYDTERERYEQEAARLTARGFISNEEVLAQDGIVQFEGTSRVEPDRRLIVKFPNTFPSFPPQVFDTGDKLPLTRHHVPSSRQFCLFGPGNARWSAKSNVEAALDEVEDHITNYARGTPVPAADTVPEPVSALIWCSGTSIFVPPPISTLEGLDTSAAVGACNLVFSETEDGGSRGVVVKATLGSRTLEAPAQYHTLCGPVARRTEARLLYLPGQPDAEAVQAAAVDYFKQLPSTKRRANLFVGIVFPEQSGDVHRHRLGWMFARITKEAKLDMIRAFSYAQNERDARVPNLAGLDQFKIVVVGCGCLGSKIAVGLAASGAAKFVLIDKDHVEPYNSVRHEVGVSAFGVPKVKALKKRLFDLNPATFGQVVDLQYGVGAINKASDEQAVVDHLASADLVIDATGMHGVSRWVNQVCTEHGVAAMYVSVTNGAWSGEIVRIAPGKACWACWNHQYDDRQPPGDQAEAIYPPGCDQPSFTGSTFETGVVANLACAVATEGLLGAATPKLQYPHPYVCWMGRDTNGLPLLKVDGLPIVQRPDCPFCNGW